MKTCILCMLLMSMSVFGQVGVGTSSPTASLDVNGNLKIRSIDPVVSAASFMNSIIVTDGGYVKSVGMKDLISATLASCTKGTFSSAGLVGVSLAGGPQTVPYDAVEFDLNSEFDTTTYTFTAKQDGIYDINVQIEASGTIGVASNFGIVILKNGTAISRSSFANVGVATVNVTAPIRKSGVLTQLVTGDTISFQLEGDILLGTVNLIGDSKDSYFSINQIR